MFLAIPLTGVLVIPGNQNGTKVVVEADQVQIAAVQGRGLALVQDLVLAQDLVLVQDLARNPRQVSDPQLVRNPRQVSGPQLVRSPQQVRDLRLSAAVPSVTIVAASALQKIASVGNRVVPAVQVAVPADLQAAARGAVDAQVAVAAEDADLSIR